MKAVAGSILAAALIAGCTPSDPVERLVYTLSSEQAKGGMVFPSGPYQGIELSPQVPVAQVVAVAFQNSLRPADQRIGTNFTILSTRQVQICPRNQPVRDRDVYTAALVATASGQKIVLLQFRHFSSEDHWWSRVYDTQ